jgi:hypothetical protein
LPASRVNNLIAGATEEIRFDASGISAATTITMPRAAVRNFGYAQLALQLVFPNATATFTAQEVAHIGQEALTNNVSFVLVGDYVHVYSGTRRIYIGDIPAYTLPETLPAPQPDQPPTVLPLPPQPILRLAIGQTQFTQNGIPQASDVAPFISDDNRTMVPLRVIAETLGATVNWNEETRTVTLTNEGTTLSVTVDQPLPGGMGTATIVEGRTFVPARYVSETMGASVRWDAQTSSVYIYR